MAVRTAAIIKEAELLAAKLGIPLEEAISKLTGKTSNAMIPVSKATGGVTYTRPPGYTEVEIEPGKWAYVKDATEKGEASIPSFSTPKKEVSYETGLVPAGPLKDKSPIILPSRLERDIVETGTEKAAYPGTTSKLSDMPVPPKQSKEPRVISDKEYMDEFESIPSYSTDVPFGKKSKIAGAALGAGALAAAGGAFRGKGVSDTWEAETGDGYASTVSNETPEQKDIAATEKEVNSLAAELAAGSARGSKSNESKKILAEMEKMANSPEYQRSTPPESRDALAQALNDAKELYKTEATKNEWLEVAQTLAGAIAQFGGAAQAGNRYQSRIDPNLGNIDYGSRTERARKDYLESARQAEGQASRDRQQWEDTELSKKGNYSLKSDVLKSKLENAQKIEADEARSERDLANDAKRMKLQDKINELRTKRDAEALSAKEASELRKLEVKDIDTQEKELKEKQKNLDRLTSMLSQEDDLKGKSADKLKEKYSEIASGAGIKLTELDETDKPGMLWGKNPDPKAREDLLKAKSAEITNLLQGLKEKRKSIISGPRNVPAGQNTQPSVESSQQTGTSATVKIMSPDGQIAEVPREKAQKYIQKGGKLVE